MVFSVLANDGLSNEGIEIMRESGMKVDVPGSPLKGDLLLETIGKYHVLLVRSATKVTQEVIDAGVRDGGRLSLIGRSGVGVDNIDIDHASENGVVVKYAPYGNRLSTAELAVGLMIDVARNITFSDKKLTEGVWQKKESRDNDEPKKGMGYELSGKTLGVVGFGRIGRRVARACGMGFGMNVIAYDPLAKKIKRELQETPELRVQFSSLDRLLEQSDFVTLHLGGSSNSPIIGARELALMKKTAILINASRGKNVDENALCHALFHRQIYGAGLDVFRDEGKVVKNDDGSYFIPSSIQRFTKLPTVVTTPHLGASTYEAQIRTGEEMAELTADYFQEMDLEGSLNTTGGSYKRNGTDKFQLRVLHDDIPGMYGKVGTVTGRYNLNVNEVAQKIGGRELTIYLSDSPASNEMMDELRDIEGVHRVWN